jgi:hypothetical protein
MQLVVALHYKPEGRGFDSQFGHWNFSLTKSFRPHYGPGVDSASNRNEYHGYLLGGKGCHVPQGLSSLRNIISRPGAYVYKMYKKFCNFIYVLFMLFVSNFIS